ncbi:MAG: glycosyltransferase family 4 protein [Bacillota bacterium]|nr:glycosyltransferase family 4 protein [Bacillota bacterium]
MKILIINHFPLEGSGSGVYTHNLAKELSSMGHEVRVIFPEHTNVEYEGFVSRTILFNNGYNEEYDLDFNFPCFTSHPRSNNTFYKLSKNQIYQYVEAFEKAVNQEVEEFKPDIIHAQHLWITPYIASKTDVPYVITAHGTDLKGFVKDSRYHPYALEGTKKASKIITISKQVDREVYELYGVDDDKKQIVMNGYDEDLFLPLEIDRNQVLKEFGIDSDYKKIVSFAGKLTHFKGVDVLLKAAKIYERDTDEEVATIIAGNGELYEELNLLKEKLELNNIYFLGHINQKQLVRLFNIADVNTVPSRTEPFGLVAVEALACGTPVVGTNQGGLPDFITGDVGRLVGVGDDMDLAYAIIDELIRDDKEERSKACSKYAKENFSWKHSIVEVEDIYKKVLGI